MIVFAHVPKTAGTSITSVIVAYLQSVAGVPLGQMLLFGREIPYDRTDLLAAAPRDMRFVSGHFRGPHYELLLPRKPFVFASMRDPFERFMSGLEHLHRLLDGGLPASADLLAKGRAFFDEIDRDRRDSSRIERAMRAFRLKDAPSLGRRVLAFGDRLVAHARIEHTEVARLCERLAEASPDPAGTLAMLTGVSNENIWPASRFVDYSPDEIELIRRAFAVVFPDELALVDLFRSEVPSLFDPEPWGCLISGLTTDGPGRDLWDTPVIPEWLNTAA